MSPVHLASNEACLHLLYQHHANISILDANQRSPLFVACALDRKECAEFLIGCLDYTSSHSIIEMKDKRGDTPLHAAACNGSTECLLLLLQYAIDPQIKNNHDLRAFDLAKGNGHQKCQEILSEYFLHYSTSSAFDSVLFLATIKVSLIPHNFFLSVYR